ncbi:acetyl-coenzyme A carboxylase carboxyl transferase subunit alpha, chloroplastic [Ziziphus jujuba]|uniref:acetyl-CoA carboxytransferase n=1 Tax=Ziziphus jujuba TaxID=326968 RepID=A0A6P6GM35_ZIZJJ|nr:acetyl-coenzyme A carboxylase carboxyl transferase subunit alpha, chloroplastic [Ziziphus jujuba]XP_015897112.1 acetyl-coenzyme A carboxylase carboxyl transferase subunit alpha, chloroplastic [Ziziphus jujuba]XP_024935152.1 acetyl-coenzyme A carboxylase carboxyl transferase subunit alpha, chloroplastic [Ziziphus jujuba]
MASIAHSSVAFSGTSASDLLRSSSNSVNGVPLRTLGRACFSTRRGNISVTAKIKKVKKHDYPWPENPDPNVKGGILFHLSSFKPLEEKQKPVTLDFEKPLLELEKKIVDVRKMADETGLDFTDQIVSLENKYQQALKELYLNLTPIQRVNIARHPNRPTFLDHVFSITDKFVELHGDRAGYDDPAIVTGIGTIDGNRYMFIGHQKGRNTKENIQRNFGMPTPHGYRKALRMMRYADHHKFPIITFIDTPGAYADLKSEELGQGEAIAQNLRTMFGLKVPILSIVIGEGGSGGALAIGCANKMLMLENAVFYVASPEACAAILWKTAKAAPKAAEKLRITAPELVNLQVADGIIPEPLGGAHADPSWTSQQIKIAINEAMDELTQMETEELLQHRMLKYRKIGGVQEGIPIDPERKWAVKKKDVPERRLDLEVDVENVKQQILNASGSSSEPPTLNLNETIEKLKKDVDDEISMAVIALGLQDRFLALWEEILNTGSDDQPLDPALEEKIQKLEDEFSEKLPTFANYETLKDNMDMLKELYKAQNLAEKNRMAALLKEEINTKFKEVLERPDIKEKYESLAAEVQNSGVTKFENLEPQLKEKILKLREEVEFEFAFVLDCLGLEIEEILPNPRYLTEEPAPELKAKLEEFEKEINHGIENVVHSSDLKDKIELLKSEFAKAVDSTDPESVDRVLALEKEIKQSLEASLASSNLKDKYEKLTEEISERTESSGDLETENSENAATDEAREEIGANHTLS